MEGEWTLQALLGPVSSSSTLQRLQLYINDEKVVTLKHMARLVEPDYGCRKEAMTQTVEADMVWLMPANLWC
jgi:hypothetical protein